MRAVPQYYVEHSREPIITSEEIRQSSDGALRGAKQISRHSTAERAFFLPASSAGTAAPTFWLKSSETRLKYRRVIWQCNGKFKGEHKCETPHLDEENH